MRTALLETATAKSMRVYVKNNFVAAKFWSLQNESWKLLSRLLPCRTTSVANSLRKQRKKFNFLGSQPADRWSRKQFFRINCPITFGITCRQSWEETSFLGRHQRIPLGSKARKPKKKTKYDINFFRVFRVSARSCLNQKNRKHQNHLVWIRITCSVVSTSVSVVWRDKTEYGLGLVRTQVQYPKFHPENIKNSLAFNFPLHQQSQQVSSLQEPTSVLNI